MSSFGDLDERTSNLVEVQYDCLRQRTEEAVLIALDDRDVWLPLSHVHNWDEDLCTLDVPEWLAIDREIE